MKLNSITTIACLLLAATSITRAQDKEARKHQGETGDARVFLDSRECIERKMTMRREKVSTGYHRSVSSA